jgi:hypothetical protein
MENKKCEALVMNLPPEEPARFCQQYAGWGTNHKGEGRCKWHGGCSVSGKKHYNYKTGLTTRIGMQEIKDLAIEFSQDEEVYNFRDLIGVMKAIAVSAINGGDPQVALKMFLDTTQAIGRLQTIEEGRKYVLNVKDVDGVIEQIFSVVRKHVKDRAVLSSIADDLARVDFQEFKFVPDGSESEGE